MRLLWIQAGLCGILIAALAACQGKPPPNLATPETKESTKMANSVSIKLGESAAAFVKRYPSAKLVRQPAGLDFYSIDWDERPRGIVTIEHAKNTIVIDDALGVSHQPPARGRRPAPCARADQWLYPAISRAECRPRF